MAGPIRRMRRMRRAVPYGRRKRRVRRSYRRGLMRRRLPYYKTLKLPLGMFPSRKQVVLRYVEDFTLNPGSASVATYIFRANSLFDPNYTSTGHQPMFFDTYASIYAGYKVRHSTITFICTDNHIVNAVQTASGTTTGQYYAANERAVRMFILRDASVNDYTSSLNTMIEEGNRNFTWKYAPQTTSMAMSKLRLRCWPHKQLNLSFNDNVLNAGTGENPSANAYFICGVDSLAGANADSMNFQVIITYHATFFDLKKNQSEN